MYRTPSSKRRGKDVERINLVPILDAVFILIFFLLMSADFLNLFEISSDVPIVSSQPPKQDEKPLALTLKVDSTGISVQTGVPANTVKRIGKNNEGKYDLVQLHEFLIQMKKQHPKEDSIILEPVVNLPYEEIVEIMDSARTLRATDEDIYVKDKDGVDKKLNILFKEVIFANILS